MPLLDGKYEIIKEHPVAPGQTLFEAAAPDGTAVSICWFDVAPDKERQFEKYRLELRRLMKAGHAAVYDVVSRPGAHYVAWFPANGSRPAEPEPELVAALAAGGFTPADAEIRRSGKRTRIYGLAWEGAAPVVFSGPPPSPAPTARSPRRRAAVRAAVAPARTLPQWLVTGGIAGSLLLIAAVLLVTSFIIRSNAATVSMPAVTGMDVRDAHATLARLGLVPEPVAIASEEPVGTVISSGASAGQRLSAGQSVRLGYAFPTDQTRPVSVPTLTGRTWPDEAARILASSGLTLGHVARIHSTVPAGTVLAQGEPVGTTVPENTQVDILVSAGAAAPSVSLPELAGRELTEALVLIAAAGIPTDRVELNEEPDATRRPGTVLAQDPPSEFPVVLVAEGTLVTLNVVEGPADAVRVPDFVGLSTARAQQLATEAGVNLSVEQVADAGRPEGVISQDPAADSWTGDDPVTVQVNTHPLSIPVPQPSVSVLGPEERSFAYDWFIEPGIGEQTARVYAITLDGEEFFVAQKQVSGGESVRGTFDTRFPMVTFRLTLNHEPYGGLQRAN